MSNLAKCVLFFFVTAHIIGQQAIETTPTIEVDPSPQQKIHRYLQRSSFYSTSQLDSSLYFVQRASTLAEVLENDSIDAKIRAHKGGLLVILQRLEEAEQLLMQNIEAPNIDKATLGTTYNNLGNSYNSKEEFDKAADHYLKAVEIFELLKDTTMLGKTLGNLGVIHARIKSYKKAIDYMDRALVFAGENERLKMNLILNLSAVYYEEKQLEKAIATSLEAEELARKNNAQSVLATVSSNLCKFYLDDEAFDVSIAYGMKALELKQKMNRDNSIVLNNLGYAYLRKGDNTKALHFLKRALPTAKGEAKSLVNKNLSQTYQNSGAYKKALQYANAHIHIKDSLNLLAQQKSVSELTAKYESEQQQQQLDLLNTKNELDQNRISNQRNYIWALAILSFLSLLVGILLYRNQKINQSLKAKKIQHRLLQAQLNPHFIFNALNSIQAFGYDNKSEKLAEYVDSFSKLMRSILESSNQDFISVEEDSQTLKEYLYLQKSSKKNGFETQITIHSDIDPQILIPPMFTQPFVENAVLHGVKSSKNGRVEVHYSEENNKLHVQIKDNGSGVDSNANNDQKLHRSMGMDIIKDRVANLLKTNNYKCSFKIDSAKTGTTVLLIFPIRYKKLG